MRAYADTSILIAAFTIEASHEIAAAWLAGLEVGALVTSSWCRTEVASGLAIKLRTKQLNEEDHVLVSRQIVVTLNGSASNIAIEDRHCRDATDLIERCRKPLRGSDALHLAIARSAGVPLWTLDRGMAIAGADLSLDVRQLKG